MKKLILLLVFIQQIAISQEDSAFPKVPYTELSAIAVEGDYIYTAGDCNTALVSTDGGDTWETISIDDRVKSIRIVPGSNGTKAYYQYSDGIYVFDVTTYQFEEISSSSLFLSSGNYQFLEVHDNTLYVISNQNIHKGVVGMYDWEKIVDFDFQNDAVVNTDKTDNYIYVGSLNGLFLRVNLATEELETRGDFGSRIYSFDMTTDDIGYFTIQNFPHPVKTIDGGETHSELSNMPENINVTGFGENVLMTVNTNRIYVSTDGGQTSTYVPMPDDGTYDLITGRFMTEDGVLYMAGRSSMVAKTDDFCQTFDNLNPYKREDLSDISMHSSGLGVAVGGYSSIIKTTDGGESWEIQDFIEDGDSYLQSVEILSEDSYIVAGNDYLNIVQGDEVTQVPVSIDQMMFNPEGNYLIGLRYNFGDRSIVKSTDGGMNWEDKAFIPNHAYHIHQAPGGKIYIPGIDGTIYTSENDGDTWDIEAFGDNLEARKISFLNEEVGLISTGLQLHITRDGGATTEFLKQGYDIKNLYFLDENNIVYTTSNEAQTNFHESTDGGETFTPTKKFCSQTNDSQIMGDNTIWMAQRGGHINKYQVDVSTSTVEIAANELNVYPNPVEKGQNIKIESESKINSISIASFSGAVYQQVNSPRSNVLSTRDLPSGIYSLSIQTENGNTKHGKLVIIE